LSTPPRLDAHVARDARTSVTVGDPLTIVLRSVLPPGATLVDPVARLRDTLPDGVRLLSTDSLHVSGGVVTGQLHVAFFRPDSQHVPAFAVAYRTSAGTDTLVSEPIPVLVQSVLPTGNATLRDINDVDRPVPFAGIAALLGLALVAALAVRILRRGHRAAVLAPTAPAAPAPSPYDLALEQLREIDAALPVERRYALVADIVRGYIAGARGVPALERTTPEILTALGANGALSGFLREADRVKFAGLRPESRAAADYAQRARSVIDALR
jgi:hypothetical protein